MKKQLLLKLRIIDEQIQALESQKAALVLYLKEVRTERADIMRAILELEA